MSSSRFLDSTYLPDLGTGSSLAIWGFRACAMGGAGCCTIVRGFDDAFGEDGGPVLGNVLALARFIGHEGRRKVSLAMPGCARITRDELSLLTAFAAAQMQDESLRDAHLTWLTARSPNQAVSCITDYIAMAFARHGHDIRLPQQPPQVAPRAGTIRAIAGGRA